jgi:hypothetical protein
LPEHVAEGTPAEELGHNAHPEDNDSGAEVLLDEMLHPLVTVTMSSEFRFDEEP